MTEAPDAPDAPPVLVVDASAVVALLADAGPAGEWVTARATGATLAAPALMRYEVGNVLRRHEMSGAVDRSSASLANQDLLALEVEVYPYDLLAGRIWELRHNLTVCDASYVSLAEWLGTPLVTLDAGIARASGVRCPVVAFEAP